MNDRAGCCWGFFPTGGMKEAFPDGLVRLQPGGVGNRVSTLCSQISLYLAESRQMFQDRMRRDRRGQRQSQRQSQRQRRRSQGRKGQGQRVGQIECPAQAGSVAARISDGLLQLPFYRAGTCVFSVHYLLWIWYF